MTAILILNYNNAEDTIHCIRSIEEHNTAPVKYVVVDNGSTKEGVIATIDAFLEEQFSDDYLKQAIDQVPNGPLHHANLLLNPENSGYAVGNNKGLEWVFQDPEVNGILLINNDVLFTEDILPRLQDDFGRLDRCGLITPLLRKKDGKRVDGSCARRFVSNWNLMVPFLLHNRNWHHWLSKNMAKQIIFRERPELIQQDSPFKIDYPSGSCLYVEKDLFQRIGAFDPGTFLYYEELILFRKLQSVNRQNYCDPTVSVIHLGGNSTRMSDNSFLQRCNLDSADLYFRKYGNCSFLQRAVWALTKISWKFRLSLKEAFRKH